MAHPNEALLRQATDALNAGDMDTFLGFHADDVVVHIVGRNQFSGDYRGKQELAGLFQRQLEALDAPPQFELHDVLATDEHGVILGTNRFAKGGQTMETNAAVVLHIANGKATELWVLSADPYAEDEFFS